MSAKQEIFRIRRKYNQWVNNQTLEDYALRFTAKKSRKWSLSRVANTALGAISFLALEAIGAAITINYGFENTLWAVTVVSIIIFLAGLPICFYAAKYGVDIDLLTRGAGFGYLGSTATSLIYSSFTFIFFALEAAIMAKALELVFGLPLAIGYVVSSVVVIPMVFHGITFISRFQLWSQPLWIVLQLLPFLVLLFNDEGLASEWSNYTGLKEEASGFNIILFGAAASVMFALVAQIGEQVDFLRFLPEKQENNKLSWWVAMISAGPGWIIVGAVKILIGSFLAVMAINHGASLIEASDPTIMYSKVFEYFIGNQHLALIIAGIFVVLCQLKINVTNAYAGSIAWSNFFSRLTHSHPGRVVWLVFNVCIALLLMELGIYQTFESTLSVYAIVAVSWVGALVADLVINKPLGLSPKHIEYKRAHLFGINPVGVGAMVIGSAIGILSYLDWFGIYAHALSHFIALATVFVVAPCIAWLTKGRYYLARQPFIFNPNVETAQCTVCENHYEVEDLAHCPAYQGYICSLCCSLDSRCQDSCKPSDKLSGQIVDLLKQFFPTKIASYINLRFLNFIVLITVVSVVTGLLLALIYSNIKTPDIVTNAILASALWKVFFILMIVAGVISWLFVLAHESRIVAQEESETQTQRLKEEIIAHEETDKQLQEAKELAEAANNAKSRYLTGISHELRTPLNTMLGYAQLMEMDEELPEHFREQISVVKRSGEHLSDLIEGLLDISNIEAGRLDIQKNRIRISSMLAQLEKMFRLQAEAKGLEFSYQCNSQLPDLVVSDEKRLRQILINLLSNAVKYTAQGKVTFSIKYKNQVAEFSIIDTGIGIPEKEMERIFRPFERLRNPDSPAVSGTGLGLTITRLLVDIMGGDLEVKNNPEGGVSFKVWLMLSQVVATTKEIKPKHIYGYSGPRLSVMVVDDEPAHRRLISDLLSPLGFYVVEAEDSRSCLSMLNSFKPNIFLIDIQMPGMNGIELSKVIKSKMGNIPIVIISANASQDLDRETSLHNFDDYLYKPIKLNSLLGRLSKYLNISWNYDPEIIHNPDLIAVSDSELPEPSICKQIAAQAEIGHLNGLRLIADELTENQAASEEFISRLKQNIQAVRLTEIVDMVSVVENG